MPQLDQILMAPGRFTVPFRRGTIEYDLDLEARQHLVFYWGHDRIECGVILDHDPGGLFVVEGAFLPWHFGVENEGPPVELLRLFSRRNKLSNGDFELGELYWRRLAENTKLRIDATAALNGSRGARAVSDRRDDDVLQSEETWPVFPGDKFRAGAYVHHPSGGAGNIRVRLVYEGNFDHPNLNEDESFDTSSKWDDREDMRVVNDSSNAFSGDGVLRIGPTTKRVMIENGDFEDAFEFWDFFNEVEASTEQANKGSLSAKFMEGGLDTASLQQRMTGVKEGDEFQAGMDLWPDDPDVPMVLRCQYKDTDGDWQTINAITEYHFSSGWRRFRGDFSLSDLDESVDPLIIVAADEIIATGAAWYADNVVVKRTRGNIQSVKWKDRAGGYNNVKIIPGRRYRVTARVRSEDDVYNGEVWFRAAVRRSPFGSDLDDDLIESPRIGPTDGKWTKVEWDFESPSGYDRLNLHIFSQDVYGGRFWMDDLKVKYADPHELVVDDDVRPSSASSPHVETMSHTPPDGAETVRYELVWEDDGEGWKADDASLVLLKTPTAAADVIRDMIEEAKLTAGTIRRAGNVLFDVNLRNRTARQVIDEVSGTGLVQPAREWRVNADGTVDWGKPEQIFTDRDNVLFTPWDSYAVQAPDARRSVARSVTDVKVIGAERQRRNRRPYVVTGRADASAGSAKMFDGSTFDRMHFLEDGSVDHKSHANGLAEATIEELSGDEPSYQLEVGDLRVVEQFGVGDWVYAWHPEEGIEDEANARTIEGRPVYPARLRVMQRSWTLGGPGAFRVGLRRSPTDEIDVTDYVVWPELTHIVLTLGNPRRSFVTNPQGGGVARQWLRYRAAVEEA